MGHSGFRHPHEAGRARARVRGRESGIGRGEGSLPPLPRRCIDTPAMRGVSSTLTQEGVGKCPPPHMSLSLMVWGIRTLEFIFFTGLAGCAVVVVVSWVSIFRSGFSDHSD